MHFILLKLLLCLQRLEALPDFPKPIVKFKQWQQTLSTNLADKVCAI